MQLATRVLDTISDFITENNPSGFTMFDWKQRFYHDVLGFQDGLEWGEAGEHVRCGFSVESSCRDLARAALLWANEGQWAGVGAVSNAEYIRTGSSWIFPESGVDYGYTVWRSDSDIVDNEVSGYNGAFSQCAFISRKHAAVIISMGDGDMWGGDCRPVWAESRWAIVSGHNITRSDDDLPTGVRGLSWSEVEGMVEAAKLDAKLSISPQQLRTYEAYKAQLAQLKR